MTAKGGYWTLTKIYGHYTPENHPCQALNKDFQVCGAPAARYHAGYATQKFYCTDCVGFVMSRYAFSIVPDPTEEELAAKKKYDLEAVMNTINA